MHVAYIWMENQKARISLCAEDQEQIPSALYVCSDAVSDSVSEKEKLCGEPGGCQPEKYEQLICISVSDLPE